MTGVASATNGRFGVFRLTTDRSVDNVFTHVDNCHYFQQPCGGGAQALHR